MTQTIDLIIEAGTVLPIRPANTLWHDYAIAIHQGKIVDLLPYQEVANRYRATTTVNRRSHLLLPGLVNSHTHVPMSLMRGLADDLPLMAWLTQHIWPAEAKWVTPDFVRDGTELAIAEMIRGGTTCFNDMYFFSEEIAATASRLKMRAVVGLIVIDFPTRWAKNSRDYLDKGVALYQQLAGNPLITTALAPHGPYTVSNEPFAQIAQLSADHQLPIHIHLHETADEIEQSLQHYGQRPIARLNELGIINQRTVAVHMTQLDPHETELVAAAGVHIIHCPESNLKLASGFTPLEQLRQQGVNLALGTDGSASNNNLDMFGELQSAALLAKGVSGSAAAAPAFDMLEMATFNAARALGLAEQIGSLEIGKAADIIAIDLNTIESQPCYHPVSQLLYATDRSQVTDLWVNGEQLLNQRQLTRIDLADLLARVRVWQQKLMENS
ncbi:TRZ/ATZ family hydrolase [Ectothiorhodospiraceae bacterium BW-2]|nr:TRZ/ATZ family hydrolase [Ectothiorhodospiraceae bacterium BW-2]